MNYRVDVVKVVKGTLWWFWHFKVDGRGWIDKVFIRVDCILRVWEVMLYKMDGQSVVMFELEGGGVDRRIRGMENARVECMDICIGRPFYHDQPCSKVSYAFWILEISQELPELWAQIFYWHFQLFLLQLWKRGSLNGVASLLINVAVMHLTCTGWSYCEIAISWCIEILVVKYSITTTNNIMQYKKLIRKPGGY